MHPVSESYPPEPGRFLRDQIRDLREAKADKAVIKSEFRRVEDRIRDATDDVDDMKAQLLVIKPHGCLHEGALGEMKTAIESNTKLSQNALKTASLASDRGFKILMGAVFGLVTFGVAFCVWAVSLSYTAEDAYKKATAIEAKLDAEPAALPPQIIITSPEYLDNRPKSKKPAPHAQEAVIDLEGLIEQALSKALENQADPLSDL